MAVTLQDIFPFVGRDIEFLPAINTYDGYLEVGMRATVVEISKHDVTDPEDPVFTLKLDLGPHDDRNVVFELDRSFYDKNGTPCLSAREAGMYKLADNMYVGNNVFELFKLVDDSDTLLMEMYQSHVSGGKDISYVEWLENWAKITGKGSTGISDIPAILERWTDAEEIRLMAGEIDPATMRDILAVTNGMAREIRAALEEK